MRDVTAADSPLARYEYAKETRRMAEDLYTLIFPPWRWLKWRRAHREVLRRVEVSRRASGV